MDSEEICERLFGFGHKIIGEFDAYCRQNVYAQGTAHINACLIMFEKGKRTYEAVHCLVKHGFTQDAFILCRSIFELFIQALQVNQQPCERGPLYIKHAAVARYKKYLEAKQLKMRRIIEIFERDPAELDRLKESYEEHRNDYPGRYWWGRESLRDLAKNFGWLEEYLFFYWWQSSFVHSASMSIPYYVSPYMPLNMLVQMQAIPDPTHRQAEAKECASFAAVVEFLRLAGETTPVFGLGKLTEEVRRECDDFCQALWPCGQ